MMLLNPNIYYHIIIIFFTDMEPQDQDDYMTTNHLLDQLAISIQQDAGRKSEEFLIS